MFRFLEGAKHNILKQLNTDRCDTEIFFCRNMTMSLCFNKESIWIDKKNFSNFTEKWAKAINKYLTEK